MGRTLHVGNLTYGTTDALLEELFGAFGTVEAVEVVVDRATGQSRGFAFVQMRTGQEAQAAIAGLGGRPVGGRGMTVSIAQPRAEGWGAPSPRSRHS